MGKRVFAAVVFALALPGCGYLDRFSRNPSSEFTEVKFLSRAAQSSTLDGGVMVYALRSDGFTQTIRLQSRQDSASMILPNGTYRFRFVGYSAPNLGGLMYCGFRGSAVSADQEEAVTLAGQALTISADLSTSRCDGAAFRPQDGNLDVTGGLPIQTVFCSSFADLAGRMAGALCRDGDESHRLSRGRISAKSKPQGMDFPRSRLVFTSDSIADFNGRFTTDLYSVGFDGTNLRREVPRIVSTGVGLTRGVKRAGVPKNRSTIVYLANDEQLTSPDLANFEHIYIKPANSSTPIRLSPLQDGTNRYRVRHFQFSDDGRWLAYVLVVCSNSATSCDHSNYQDAKLYVVDLDSTSLTPVLMSPPATQPLDVFRRGLAHAYCAPDCEEPFRVVFNRLADGSSSRIAFIGTFGNQLHKSPVSTNLVGTPIPVIHSVGLTGANYFDTGYLDWNSAGDKLLFTSGEDVPPWNDPVQYRLYAWVIGVSSSGQIIGDNITHPTGTKGSKGWAKFYPSPTEDRIFYVRDRSGFNEAGSFYISDFSNVSSPIITRAFENNDTSSWGIENIERAKWSPDGQKIIFFSNHDNNSSYYAYLRRLSDVPDLIHKVSPGTGATYEVLRGGQIEGEVLAISNSQAAFAAKAGSATNSLPFVVDLAVANPLGVSAWGGAPPNSNYDVKSFYQDNTLNSLIFLFDDATDGTYRAFVKDGATPGGQTALPMPTNMVTGTEVFLPGREFNNSAIGTALMYTGPNLTASTTGQDLWILKDYTAPLSATNTLVKLTRSWNGPSGIGRFRFGLMNYRKDGGQLNDLTLAMESPCFDYSIGGATDGDLFNTSRKFPVGGSASAPFVAFLDVFTDETDSCSGPFQRQIFSNGMAAGIPGQASGFAHDTGGAVGAEFFKVFVKDL
jgi:hypothetical protein